MTPRAEPPDTGTSILPPALSVTDEAARVAALRELRLLDTLPEQVFDDIVLLASQICGTPIGLVSLVDSDRQWFKARVGLNVTETHRDIAFCAHAIVAAGPVFAVEDATLDLRFRDNPMVTGDPHIRFYAGAPIVMADGHALGTVCVIDTVPRVLDAAQLRALQALSRQTAALLESRLRAIVSERQARERERLAVQATEERRRSAELLELVLRAGDLGLWDLNVPASRFTANGREYAMLGYTAPDTRLAALDWRALMHPDDWSALGAAMTPHLAGEAGFYTCEHRMRHRDGHSIWVLAHGVVVERDAIGAPLRIVGTHLDITSRIDNRHALQRTRDLLQRMGTLAKVGGWELDLASGKVVWTPEVYRIHELDPSTELDKVAALEFYAPSARPVIQAAIDNAIAHGTSYELELPFVTATGRALKVRTQGEAVMEGGRVVRLFGAFQDVTERHRAEQVVIENQRRLRMVTDHLPALIAEVDHEQRYRFLNAHFQRVYGTDVQAAIGRTMRETRSEEAYAQLAPHVEAALRGENTSFSYTEHVGERLVHYQSNYIPDIDRAGRVHGFYAITFDITELHETQLQLESLARVDTLTGLPNRRQFDERIEEALQRSQRQKQTVAVMFLDIDHFKRINDAFGHAVGDTVLCEFGRRLRACVRTTDVVARLAGDEFVVLLEGIDSENELKRVAEKVVTCIRPPFQLGGSTLEVTTSVGVAARSGAETSAAEMLALADAALYQAKRQGRDGYVLA
jgi:diguanylate cyclase